MWSDHNSERRSNALQQLTNHTTGRDITLYFVCAIVSGFSFSSYIFFMFLVVLAVVKYMRFTFKPFSFITDKKAQCRFYSNSNTLVKSKSRVTLTILSVLQHKIIDKRIQRPIINVITLTDCQSQPKVLFQNITVPVQGTFKQILNTTGAIFHT